MHITHTSLQTHNLASTSSLNSYRLDAVYRLDALPDVQTTAHVLASQAEAIVHTGKTWPQATKQRTGD